MPEGEGGICYKQGLVVHENYQVCDITNRKIRDQLKEQVPQATFSCNAEHETCNFQFWVDQEESFYCTLDTCKWSSDFTYSQNQTSYTCENIKCACVPDRMLCGKDGGLDLAEFLAKSIQGPASFSSLTTVGGSSKDGSRFEEPAMNDLISNIFGDSSITLDCRSGECLYKTEIPGYERPVPKINTPMIAGVIAGCALFLVALVLLAWYFSRKAWNQRGAIYLDDADDENARMMANHKPATLQFENVNYNINGKPILSGIQGIAQPGQLMAIMGASGAGKTSFLDILARKNKRGNVTGQFYVNGERIADNDYRSVVGFVDQDDILLATLTVHETILNSALLRLPRDMGYPAKEQRVYEVEKQLGIYHIRDQLIGSEEGRGISGGEKRRVSIACELVTSPSILFLDEPTSGLDAYNAFNVIECLVNLAKSNNRTVIFTIHQPRSNIIALFDQLVLLAKGRVVYSGPFQSCQSYFDHLGYSCPSGFNIADYLIDLTMHAEAVTTQADDTTTSNFDMVSESNRTASSSVRAIKSIASASNVSMDNSSFGSQTDSMHRPKGVRRLSLKQQQDRKLYTRKKSGLDTPQTPATEDDGSILRHQDHENGAKLPKYNGQVPLQVLDDPHQLPPPAQGRGTDLDALIAYYASSDVAGSQHDDIHNAIHVASTANGRPNGDVNGTSKTGSMSGYKRIGRSQQFVILSRRTWTNLHRNPALMLTHYAIAILVAVLLGFLFYGLSGDIKGFQNRLGLLFFVLALFGFGNLTVLTIFSSERLLFLRERANGYYSPIPYFLAKVVFDIVPLRLIPPIILGVVVYPMTGLVPAWPEFLRFMLTLVLFNLAAAAVCLLIGIVCANGGVANLIGSLFMLFSLLFGGLFLNHDAMPAIGVLMQKLSIFHFGFESLMVNEVRWLTLTERKFGLDIEVPGASILSAFGFDVSALWRDVLGLGVFAICGIILAYTAMHILLVEKR
ncbi:hypothetical protein MMC25_006311 [Agyrium rufum]|nr:hypothetical protein [Agyrium rufum]